METVKPGPERWSKRTREEREDIFWAEPTPGAHRYRDRAWQSVFDIISLQYSR
jgi:hypothetical protein